MAITATQAKATPDGTEQPTICSKNRTPKMTRRRKATILKTTRRKTSSSSTIFITKDTMATEVDQLLATPTPTAAASTAIRVTKVSNIKVQTKSKAAMPSKRRLQPSRNTRRKKPKRRRKRRPKKKPKKPRNLKKRKRYR